jgi:hypothetical protein
MFGVQQGNSFNEFFFNFLLKQNQFNLKCFRKRSDRSSVSGKLRSKFLMQITTNYHENCESFAFFFYNFSK